MMGGDGSGYGMGRGYGRQPQPTGKPMDAKEAETMMDNYLKSTQRYQGRILVLDDEHIRT